MTVTELGTEAVAVHSALARRRYEIERTLRARVGPRPDVPAALAAAMETAVFPGGKRWRPLLTLAAAELAGATWQSALTPAAAVELIHCSSLVFDDLPCMDDADLRRGEPSLHRMHGEGVAVLAGLGLLTMALGMLAEAEGGGSAAVALAARYVGPGEMLGGQALDLARAAGRGAEGGTNAAALNRKTTAPVELALVLGGARGRLTPVQSDALLSYGREVGLAYQEMDDLLDGDAEEGCLKRSAVDDRRCRAIATLEAAFPPSGARSFLIHFVEAMVPVPAAAA